jgi:small subunit ribosomal protein S21
MGVKVYLRRGDDSEDLKRNMRKFKKLCEKDEVIRDIRSHEYYEKPSVKRKKDDHRRRLTIIRAMREKDQRANATPETIRENLMEE